jgi:hypothetical protein
LSLLIKIIAGCLFWRAIVKSLHTHLAPTPQTPCQTWAFGVWER